MEYSFLINMQKSTLINISIISLITKKINQTNNCKGKVLRYLDSAFFVHISRRIKHSSDTNQIFQTLTQLKEEIISRKHSTKPFVKEKECHCPKTLLKLTVQRNQKRKFLQQYQHNQLTKQQHKFDHMHFNLTGVSPAVGKVLCMGANQLRGEKSRMVQHHIEKVSQKDFEALKLLRQMSEVKQMDTQKHLIRKKTTNLIEAHSLSLPSKEYFQKHPKADNFFKPILELNYVLHQCKESLNNLPSSKEVNQYLKEHSQQTLNINRDHKNTNPKDKLIEHLEEKKQQTKQTFFGIEAKTKLVSQQNTGVNSNITTAYQTNNEEMFILKERPKVKLGRFADPIRTQKSPSSDSPVPQSFHTKKDFTSKEASPILYVDSRIKYTKQFDKVMQGESTESKINNLLHNLQIKQHLVSKQLTKHIHKL